ncbi:uncharacterized protein [Nicotiana tomentosiformis]|uniref:Uncharacterized protein isoform X1 n=1 Tax=Nicotiana tabacum TaxID=4097 RepID=A0A1S4B4C1_TOBAC|nr:uncharacterized protein LOC104120582 isoform X1 [Nicotiana tomentosiformis]XP_009630672.1 uncharacterized protein LOC104120582 isoform X1 [Nicotiana tomentosiformis]XP_009630673.1 uncharacterized protein LOC104120582 isoform X1 [Nicotiana tomentosiformis]XP_016483777.1 PREDICTED: uncharacterized protein LOC107804406 isoform X1 [Nicotiana tabacum]XP_016483785.1 PREDICTED: uncharacterized protein LOC107804406 isoform X1 [Nicotiana tabacum]XP_016483793.1 PREDICTED: uncharacterized protein LOC1
MEDPFLHLASLSSYIAQQFAQFIEDLICIDIFGWSENLVGFGGQHVTFTSNRGYRSVHEASSFSSRVSNQGSSLIIRERSTSNPNDSLPVHSRLEIVRSNQSYGGFSLIFEGLMLPVYGLRYAWKLMVASWRCFISHIRCALVQVQSVISRVLKTLHGSSDDIGWMQRAPEMAPVVDGSARFRELLQDIRNGQHTLPDSFVYLLIPGFFSNHGPLYFVSTKKFFSKMGLICHIAKIHSEASVEQNAWELKQYIEELHWGSGKRVMLLGHSKGGVDASAALSKYWHELKDKVAGLAFVQSPYGGTPVASDILREGQIADKETRRIMEFLICKLIKGDIRALEDLTYEKRQEFIKNHKLPDDIPLISFHSEASIALNVIATMSHIAHAELPWLPLPGFGDNDSADVIQAGCKVPVMVPVSAGLAFCALHLQLRYGEKSDGLVTCRDAEVPGSVVVKPDMKLDHAWMVYSSWKKDPNEPDASEMCEAMLTMLVELGKNRKKLC